jgi:hypothetical protein
LLAAPHAGRIGLAAAQRAIRQRLDGRGGMRAAGTTVSDQFMVFSSVAGGIGLAGKLGILLLGFLPVLRSASGRARCLTWWALVVLTANVLLPRVLEAAMGLLRLYATAAEAQLWAEAAIDLLPDIFLAIGLALLRQALRRPCRARAATCRPDPLARAAFRFLRPDMRKCRHER